MSQRAGEEGLARGLNTDPFAAKLHRYSERTIEVMKIWTEVFAGQTERLVRVVATQHVNPWTAEQVLGWRDTAQWVDALATAPYIGYDISNIEETRTTTDLGVLFARLRQEIPERVAQGVQNKNVAGRFGKRYITYEAGQHVIMHNNTALLAQLNRDPRMEGIYDEYINAWRVGVGDALTLFLSTGPISVWGAWGAQEYTGQPISETPKLRSIMRNRTVQ